MNSKFKKLGTWAAVAALSVVPAFAEGEPLDVTATGTAIAGYATTAAAAGLGIMAALYGIRIIIRAFRSVK